VASTDTEHRALCRDGMLTRAYEYFDTGHLKDFLEPRP
jgi:hypothetical protein